MLCALVLIALVPMAVEPPWPTMLAILAPVLAVPITFETLRFTELRDRIRHRPA
jgi:hypothetical protein